jgi:hypothetical protein
MSTAAAALRDLIAADGHRWARRVVSARDGAVRAHVALAEVELLRERRRHPAHRVRPTHPGFRLSFRIVRTADTGRHTSEFGKRPGKHWASYGPAELDRAQFVHGVRTIPPNPGSGS